jgi:hypothetical protein
MIIAFSGSEKFTLETPGLKVCLTNIFKDLPKDTQINVGGCIGLDEIVQVMAYDLGFHVHAVIPANRSKVFEGWKLFCTTCKEMEKDTSYRNRNEEMVRPCDILYAFPEGRERSFPRSGTWLTIRIARSYGKVVKIFLVGRNNATTNV